MFSVDGGIVQICKKEGAMPEEFQLGSQTAKPCGP